MGLFDKIKAGFSKTKEEFKKNIDNVVRNFKTIDEDFWEELEETLIMSDVGVQASMGILENLKIKAKEKKLVEPYEVINLLKEEIKEVMEESKSEEERFPKIILVMGINGVGKTTSIGKLACNLKSQGKKVLLAAADTFRAAAIEQLDAWASKAGVDIVKQSHGSDPGAVVFDAIASGKSKKVDVIICDTAGRLHNKQNLMKELEKITTIVKNNAGDMELEVLLVLDANTGQNAVEQAKNFKKVTNIDGIILTKVDSSSKGGIVISIKDELNIPIKYVGVGEGIDDLKKFDPKEFVESILGD